jgi:hypothetical protein
MNKTYAVIAVVLLGGLVLGGGVALAVSETVEREVSNKPRHFPKGIYVGSDNGKVVSDTANKMTHTGGGRIDFAFSALGNDGGTMAQEWAHIVTVVEGAKFGDPCFVGIGTGNTNPISNLDNQQVDIFDCQVVDAGAVSGVVKLRHIGPQSRAALEDAGYQIRTISNVP